MEDSNLQTKGGETPVGVKNNARIFLIGLGSLVLGVAVLAVLVGVTRVYAFTATDNFSVAVAKVLRLPAGKVGDKSVLYSDYADDLKAIKTMRAYDQANSGPNADLTDEQMSDQVLLRLANNILVDKAAVTYGATVETADTDALKSALLQQFESLDKVNEELKTRYGWDYPTYEKKVMRGYVLQNKITEKISADEKLQTEVKTRAQAVLDQIKAGADFATMAGQYGQDGTKDTGGDLGFFTKGEMVQEFEAAAFALKDGEVSPELVRTKYGYHIIKVEERKTEQVVNPDTKKKESVESVRARHILFLYPSADTYLASLAKTTNFHLYLRVHNPFVDLNK